MVRNPKGWQKKWDDFLVSQPHQVTEAWIVPLYATCSLLSDCRNFGVLFLVHFPQALLPSYYSSSESPQQMSVLKLLCHLALKPIPSARVNETTRRRTCRLLKKSQTSKFRQSFVLLRDCGIGKRIDHQTFSFHSCV